VYFLELGVTSDLSIKYVTTKILHDSLVYLVLYL